MLGTHVRSSRKGRGSHNMEEKLNIVFGSTEGKRSHHYHHHGLISEREIPKYKCVGRVSKNSSKPFLEIDDNIISLNTGCHTRER